MGTREEFESAAARIHDLYNVYEVGCLELLRLYKRQGQIRLYVEFLDNFLEGLLFSYSVGGDDEGCQSFAEAPRRQTLGRVPRLRSQ